MKKEYYEISLWEDYLVPQSGSVPSHYEERKVAVLGSSSMSSSIRAIEPELREKIDGTNSFTFKMFYKLPRGYGEDDYEQHEIDPLYPRAESRKLKSNPLVELLFPEAKVKLKWKGRWYNLVIKTMEKNNADRSITYTCIDNYVNELSRTGFNIIYNKKLQNSTDTAANLAEIALKGSDWSVNHEKTELLQEWLEDAVFEVVTSGSFEAQAEHKGRPEIIPPGAAILVYYQQLQELMATTKTSGQDYIQFAYSEKYEQEDYSMLVTNNTSFSATMSWSNSNGVFTFTKSGSSIVIDTNTALSTRYRAKRLVRTQRMEPDEVLDRYVGVYRNTLSANGLIAGSEFYGYSESVFEDATLVEDLIVNGKDFSNTRGWEGRDLFIRTYPVYDEPHFKVEFPVSYLRFAKDVLYYNSLFQANSTGKWKELKAGNKFVLRYKAKAGKDPTAYVSGGIEVSVKEYQQESLYKTIKPGGQTYMEIGQAVRNGDWVEHILTVTKSFAEKEMKKERMGLFLNSKNSRVWLEEVQLFDLVYTVKDGQEVRINPLDFDIESIGRTRYTYYTREGKEIRYLWENFEDWTEAGIEPVYVPDFEKIRTIEVQNSNRFNILQTIAETFECWVKFEVEQDAETGKLAYDEKGQPKKRVYFVNDFGQESGMTFTYGIDLKGMTRNTDTNEITTKTIVTPLDSDFANHGFCTISRAYENYPKVNYLINFDYYVSQGLLDASDYINDLYSKTGINFYNILREENLKHQAETDVLTNRGLELVRNEGLLTVYDGLVDQIREEIQRLRGEIMDFYGEDTWEKAEKKIDDSSPLEIKRRVETIKSLEYVLGKYIEQRDKVEVSVNRLELAIEASEDRMKASQEKIETVESKFFEKYHRFIQEGTWTGDGYIDDDRYYLDAQAVSTTSGYPKVRYTISVMRLSFMEDFKGKEFRLGDIARVEDTEFLGYTIVDGLRTPIKERVLISELVSYLDTPDKDVITVQSYRSQFEDLFQRIQATVQALKFPSDDRRTVTGGVAVQGGSVSTPSFSIPELTIVEGGSYTAPDLLWDYNKSDIQIEQDEVQIGEIESEISTDTTAQAHLQIEIEADKETELLIRIYDNEGQELYSPISRKVSKGMNEVGVPHSHLKLMAGDHTFRVTAQLRDGSGVIRTRGVMYTIEVQHTEVFFIEFIIDDLTIRQPEFAMNPTEIYAIGVSRQGFATVLTAAYKDGERYKRGDFAEFYTLSDQPNVRAVAIEFDGVYERLAGQPHHSLVTEDKPWIFWIDQDWVLWGQYGNEVDSRIKLATSASSVSALRGWNNVRYSDKDQGLVVAYTRKDSDGVFYRTRNGIGSQLPLWTPSEIAGEQYRLKDELGTEVEGVESVQLVRLNDYRVGFVVGSSTGSRLYLGEAFHVGQAVRSEYIEFNVGVDKSRSRFTAYHVVKDEPYPIPVRVETDDNKVFRIISAYEWVVESSDLEQQLSGKTISGKVQIKEIRKDSLSPYALIVEMEREVTLGFLSITLNPWTIYGKIRGTLAVDFGDTVIEIYNMRPNVQEYIEFNAGVDEIDFVATAKKTFKDVAPTEYIEFNAGVDEVDFVATRKGMLDAVAPTEYIEFNTGVDEVEFISTYAGEIIG